MIFTTQKSFMFLKRYIFLFIFLFIHFVSNAQKHNLQTATDLLISGELNAASKAVDSLLKTDVSLSDRGFLMLRKATISRMKGKHDAFLNQLDTVFKIAAEINNKILEADALIQKITALSGKQGQGLAALAKYAAIAEETQNYRLLYNANVALASYSLKGNNTEKAREFYKKALQADSNNKHVEQKQNHLYIIYSNILYKEGKIDSSMFHLKKVLEKAIKRKKKVVEAQTLSVLGYRGLKNKSYTESYNWSLQANQIAKDNNYQLYVESSYANMAMLLNEVEETENLVLKQKLYTFFEANSFESTVLNIEKKLSEMNKFGQKLKILEVLSSYYQRLGNLEKALFYKNEWSEKNALQLEREQLNIDNFLKLEIEMSNLEKQKENLEIKDQLNFTQKSILILSIVLLLVISLFIWSQQKVKIKNEKIAKLSVEKNLISSTKKRVSLEKMLKEKELELNSFINDMIEKNSQIEILQKKLKKSTKVNTGELTEELKSMKFSASKTWLEFTFKFKQLYPNFLNNVKKQIPNITPTETKLSILTFLNLSSKEIGNLLGISATSVNQGKYRLKKKISSDKDLSLLHFLQKITSKSIDKS